MVSAAAASAGMGRIGGDHEGSPVYRPQTLASQAPANPLGADIFTLLCQALNGVAT